MKSKTKKELTSEIAELNVQIKKLQKAILSQNHTPKFSKGEDGVYFDGEPVTIQNVEQVYFSEEDTPVETRYKIEVWVDESKLERLEEFY